MLFIFVFDFDLQIKSTMKDLVRNLDFSLAFYAEKCENTVFGYKELLKFKYDNIFISATQNLYISFLLFLEYGRFVPLVGRGVK